MRKWLKCCFPENKEELPISDKEAEVKEDQINNNNKNQIETKDIPDINGGNIDSSINKDNQTNLKSQKKNNNENEKSEDPLLHYINSNREISEEEIKTAPIVVMTEEGGKLLNGKEIKINAAGMIGGRGAKDGVSIFGKNNNNSNDFIPDFELNYEEKLSYPYIFAIYFQRETKNFFIRAYPSKGADNRILFVKLAKNYELPLKQKEIITAGNVIFQITPVEENKIEIANLSKKDSSNNLKQIFDPNENKEVTIGRDKNCNFAFPKDKSFSRHQTTFSYDDNNKEWTILDGMKDKSSTNGTWVFGTHSFQIKDQLIVEILSSKIKFSLVQNE